MNFCTFYKNVLMPQLNRKICWFQLKGKENRKEENCRGVIHKSGIFTVGDSGRHSAALPPWPPLRSSSPDPPCGIRARVLLPLSPISFSPLFPDRKPNPKPETGSCHRAAASPPNRRRSGLPGTTPTAPSGPPRRAVPPCRRNRHGAAEIGAVIASSPAPVAAHRACARRRPATSASADHSGTIRVSSWCSTSSLPSPSRSLTVPASSTTVGRRQARRRRAAGDQLVQPAAPLCSSPSPLSSADLPHDQFRSNATNSSSTTRSNH